MICCCSQFGVIMCRIVSLTLTGCSTIYFPYTHSTALILYTKIRIHKKCMNSSYIPDIYTNFTRVCNVLSIHTLLHTYKQHSHICMIHLCIQRRHILMFITFFVCLLKQCLLNLQSVNNMLKNYHTYQIFE